MKNSFRFTCLILLLLSIQFIILMVSCRKEKPIEVKQTSFNTSFDLQLAQKILLKSGDKQLMVELRSLNDNRCHEEPCEHPGNATVRVFLSAAADHAEAETNLCIGKCDTQNKTSDTVHITLKGVNYTMTLNKIHGSDNKKAELTVKIN